MSITNQIKTDIENSFNYDNGFIDILKVYRGSILSEQISQTGPILSVDFIDDSPVEGDYMDDNSMRTIVLSIQGKTNTSSENFDDFDNLIDNTIKFLRSSYCTYKDDIDIGQITKLEGDGQIAVSYFTIQISIKYIFEY